MDAAAPTAELWAKTLKYSPAYMGFDMTTRMFSPYVYGTMTRNPLERIVTRFHYDAVCATEGPELFIGATNVRTGKIKLFSGDDIDPEAILASACLPSLFQAVEIDDPETGTTEAYWDGGYTGNPALFPLFEVEFQDDILIVNINPLYRAEIPTDSQSIANRINEISFNSSLLRELRAIEFVKRLIADGKVQRGTMKDVLVHMIADDELMNMLNVATKTIPTPLVIARLKAAGAAAADRFLTDHKDDLGPRRTVDLAAMFN